jgi:hypothetical protein
MRTQCLNRTHRGYQWETVALKRNSKYSSDINAYSDKRCYVKKLSLQGKSGIHARKPNILSVWEKRKQKEVTGPVEGPGKSRPCGLDSRAHDRNPWLPRTLTNVLDTLQDEVLQLNVTLANAPMFLNFSHPLVALSHSYVASAERC